MSTAPFLSRQFGDYLLVAQLSEDALGPVFRALYAADERRFVRLRILRNDELLAEPIERAIVEAASRGESLAHPAIVDRQQLDVVENLPFLTWDETSGWTLDTLLARVRALGVRIPAEYALLIAERIAAALEHAHRSSVVHGLLWPGFVAISHDAAVRVGGFGLAPGVLPSLSQPRLRAEIAPYVTPEIRAGGDVGPDGDVYGLGAILAELLTGRRPSLSSQSLELRAGDPRSEELEAFLHRCMAPAGQRFASAVDAHRELQLMVTGNPFSLYTANLALFLYKLLNPESQLTAPAGWEATNPVSLNATAPPEVVRPLAIVTADAPAAQVETEAPPAAGRAAEPEPAPQAEPERPATLEPEPASASAATEAVAASPEPPAREVPPPPDVWVEPAAAFDAAPESAPVSESAAEAAVAAILQEPVEPGASTVSVFEPGPLPRPLRAWATAWTRPAAALAAAAGVTLGAFLVAGQLRTSAPAPPRAREASRRPVESAPPAVSEPIASAAPSGNVSAAAAAPIAVVMSASASAGRLQPASTHAARASKPVPAGSRQPAEDLRLRAALARIEADRVNAKETAGEIFGQGRTSEEEGERLLRQRDYEAAQLAFSRAARLFQQAQEITWERRLREADLSSAQ